MRSFKIDQEADCFVPLDTLRFKKGYLLIILCHSSPFTKAHCISIANLVHSLTRLFLKFIDLPTSVSQVLGLEVCTVMSGFKKLNCDKIHK